MKKNEACNLGESLSNRSNYLKAQIEAIYRNEFGPSKVGLKTVGRTIQKYSDIRKNALIDRKVEKDLGKRAELDKIIDNAEIQLKKAGITNFNKLNKSKILSQLKTKENLLGNIKKIII